MRWWYLRHGLHWPPVLGCCLAAGLVAAVVEQWPATALALLPIMLGACAAAAGFLFDEPALAVVAVTPRGAAWRRTTRLGVVAAPAITWVLLVHAEPGQALPVPGWLLAGIAASVLFAGLAALAGRHDVAAPGSQLAALAVVGALAPVVVTMFTGWDTPYPLDTFSSSAWWAWLVVAAVAGGVLVGALRPGLRR